MIIFCPREINLALCSDIKRVTGKQYKDDFNAATYCVLTDHQNSHCHTVVFLKKENTDPTEPSGRLQKGRAPDPLGLMNQNA